MLIALMFAATLSADDPASRDTALAVFDAFNRRDLAAMEALYARDAVLTSSDFCAPRGRADIRRTFQVLFDAFPDVRDEIGKVVAEDGLVAVQFTAKASGLELPIVTIFTIRDGLIVRDETVFDTGGAPCQA